MREEDNVEERQTMMGETCKIAYAVDAANVDSVLLVYYSLYHQSKPILPIDCVQYCHNSEFSTANVFKRNTNTKNHFHISQDLVPIFFFIS